MRISILCLFSVLTSSLVGCGGDDLEYAVPTGLVAGEVRDGVTGELIDSAAISLWVGNRVHETTTGGDGRFEIGDIPSGSTLWLDVVKDGYASERHFIGVDDTAGEQPQNNSRVLVDVDMYPNSNRVRITLEMGIDGISPGAGIQVQLRGATADFELIEMLTGATDGGGAAIIPGVATWQSYDVRILPFDYQGQTYTYQTSYGNSTPTDDLDIVVF